MSSTRKMISGNRKRAAAAASIFEPLESRQLFSIALVPGGVQINEPSGNNNISITELDNTIEPNGDTQVKFVDNQTTVIYKLSQLGDIEINTGAGNDTVKIVHDQDVAGGWQIIANLG